VDSADESMAGRQDGPWSVWRIGDRTKNTGGPGLPPLPFPPTSTSCLSWLDFSRVLRGCMGSGLSVHIMRLAR
jgi:hypothetical protein